MNDIFEGQYPDQLWDEFTTGNESYYGTYATRCEGSTLIPSLDYFMSNEMQGTDIQEPTLPQISEAELIFGDRTSTPTDDQQYQHSELLDSEKKVEGKMSEFEEIKAL